MRNEFTGKEKKGKKLLFAQQVHGKLINVCLVVVVLF
jgi:hypothetical protein